MSLEEAASAQGAGIGSPLIAGYEQLSSERPVVFTLYKRLILPADGFIFFAPAASVVDLDTDLPLTVTTTGSLHLSQTMMQEEDTSYARQDVILTTKTQTILFESTDVEFLYVLELPNGSLAAFNGQRKRYDPAAIWHYIGRALLPFEASQFIESPDAIPADNVVSNSMPFWLAMSTSDLPVYPSFLVPQNTVPPFVSVKISGTDGLGSAPLLGPDSTQTQLTTETAKFTFYGVRNNGVLDFQRALLQNSLDGIETGDAPYGVMNSPVPVDVDRPQSEFGIKAQQKTMSLDLNYYQARAREEARKRIVQAFITLTVE